MAARKEWSEWHLTPRGWERGSTRLQGKGNTWTDEPEDRVLSFVYTETETAGNGTTFGGEETWRSKSADNIVDLLERFGTCPQRL
jgi:hypothetical protein